MKNSIIILLILGIGFLVYIKRETPLSRCKAIYNSLKYSEDFERIQKELDKQGINFDERLESNCKMWIKNGQKF